MKTPWVWFLAGLELLDYQPAYHLEDLTLNTGNGTVSVNFSVKALEEAGSVLEGVVRSGQGGSMEGVMAALGVFEGSAGIQVDDDIIAWQCLQQLQSGNKAEAEMCATLVRSGEFLGKCPFGGVQCSEDLEQIRAPWREEGRFDVVL